MATANHFAHTLGFSGFPAFRAELVRGFIARKARERGARIVALTDSPTSPLAALGDLTLYLPAPSRFNATSDSTIRAVIESLCAAVARHAKNSVKSAATMTEFVLPWLHQEGKSV